MNEKELYKIKLKQDCIDERSNTMTEETTLLPCTRRMSIDEIVQTIDDSSSPLEWLMKYTDILPDDMKVADAVQLAWSYASKEIISLTKKAIEG